jgi:RHS repeat-associated protein
VPTDKLFTGQRLDDTGLYFYNARYYDATIGRFISADTIIPNPMNPQAFNRYSYCFNNPLKYVDPSGYKVVVSGEDYRIIQEMLQRDDLSSAEWWFLLSVVTSPEYKAYEAYRKSYRESADELEESEKTILFKTGDTSGYDIMSQQNDDVFTITLDQDLIGISGHEEYWRTLISFEILRIQPFLFVHKTRDELRQDLADVLMVSADILDVSSAGSDAIPPEYIVYAAGAYLGITLSAPYVAFAILCVGALGPDALRLAADVVAP